MQPWREPYHVRAYETDRCGRLKIRSVFDYLQEAAGNHADNLGLSVTELLARGYAWVLARLRLTMDRWPSWRDEILVETWPSGYDRLSCTREFRLLDRTGRPLGSASSAWLILDVATKRIARVPAFVSDAFPPDLARPAEAGTMAKLPPLDETLAETSFPVRQDDLDMNHHVNNALYASWAVEAVTQQEGPALLPNGHRELAGIDIRFRAEAVAGDTVLSRLGPGQDPARSLRHELIRAADGRELAQAETLWR